MIQIRQTTLLKTISDFQRGRFWIALFDITFHNEDNLTVSRLQRMLQFYHWEADSMFIHFLKNGIKFQYKVLLIFILTIMFCLPGCVVAQGGRVYRPEPRQEPRSEPRPVYPSGIEGQWTLNAGNAIGRLEFRQAREGLIGGIWFDAYQQWEELTDLYSDPRTGQLEFTRPGAGEHYSGTLSGNYITGQYRIRGLTYPWEARRETGSVGLPRIDGPWILNAGNATGRVEFSWVRKRLAGRIWFDAYQRWEELAEVSFDPESGRVQFNRPNANEWYIGTVSGSRISGTYTVAISYPWEGRREARKSSPSKIEGLWMINAGNALGKLELYWTRNTLAGRIWFDVYQRWEELTDLSFDQRAGRLEFTRPHGNEHYSGTLSGDQLSGAYSVQGPTYPWEARR
jgi:hypothetical protein